MPEKVGNSIALPDYVSVGPGTYMANIRFHRYAQETIRIGNYCSIAQEVLMLAGGQHRTDTVSTYPFDVMHDGKTNQYSRHYVTVTNGRMADFGIEIGHDVWVGWGARIVGNVLIGSGAVIAAGAVVMTDVPPYGIAVGNPARVTKFRFDERTVEDLLAIRWWDWSEEKIKANRDWFYRPVAEFILASRIGT